MNKKKDGLCPFHYLKYIVNKVDILLCPYNYVLDPDIRKSIGLDLTDTIIVFDEAHNVETASEDACSVKVSVDDLKFTYKFKNKNKKKKKKKKKKFDSNKRNLLTFIHKLLAIKEG